MASAGAYRKQRNEGKTKAAEPGCVVPEHSKPEQRVGDEHRHNARQHLRFQHARQQRSSQAAALPVPGRHTRSGTHPQQSRHGVLESQDQDVVATIVLEVLWHHARAHVTVSPDLLAAAEVPSYLKHGNPG